MAAPTLAWPSVTYADFANGLSFIQYIKECQKTLDRQAIQAQIEAQWNLEVDSILPDNSHFPTGVQHLKAQTNSPAAYYHFRSHLRATLSRIPNDREIFYLHLRQQRWADQDNNLQSMRNAHGQFVKTPVFSHLALSQMRYADMLEWFPLLNARLARRRTWWNCEKAGYLWAGLVLNVFCMAGEGEKEKALTQANGPASQEHWGDEFEYFTQYSAPGPEQQPPTQAIISLTRALASMAVDPADVTTSQQLQASAQQNAMDNEELNDLSTAMSQLATDTASTSSPPAPPLSAKLSALPVRRKRSGSPLASERRMLWEDD
ncbi:MAG: hypothetical protein Q9187_004528, partial [Circinaria calcarea]